MSNLAVWISQMPGSANIKTWKVKQDERMRIGIRK